MDAHDEAELVVESLIGHYAGAVTRFAAFLVDAVLSIGGFLVGAAGAVWVINLFARTHVPSPNDSPWWFVPFAAWLFVYFWYCYWLAGKTPGKALFGLRVVTGDGTELHGGRAAVRVLAFTVSWAIPLVGFGGVVLGSRHRALHDVVAGTAVVYDYDARAAHLRFLGRHPHAPTPRTQGEHSPDAGAFTTAG
ncbi:MAG TPA: RDD family protein [Acidimicrobiia bacterium]|jgi:uncharacterized RDD family membrane protein YckC